MRALNYQVVVQWSDRNSRFEAHSPTLMQHASYFAPEFPRIAYGDTMSGAVENYLVQADKLLAVFKNLAILPPPADVGHTDPVEYVEEEDSLGKMVL